MPRHTSLIPLSHDHHEALLIALRLKKGGPTSGHDHLWPQEFDKQVHSLKIFFERELLPHFTLEETLLFPVAATITELQKTVEDLLTQHEVMRKMIGIISHAPTIESGDEHLKTILTEFGVLLEAHVRTEERELFPKLEEAEKEGRVTLPKLK